MSGDRKHIVFILSDQHHAGVAGFAGNRFVRTPHLDRLAGEGAVFDAAYCPSPLCVPSRMAMLAGMLPNHTKCYDNQSCLRGDRATFVHCLDQAGYHTVLGGRMHFNGPNQRHGYLERLVGDICNTVIGGPEQPYGELLNTTWQHVNCLKNSGGGHSSVLEYDRAVVNAAVKYIDEYGRDEPLFLTVGLYKPHCPFVCEPDLYRHYYETLPELPEQRLKEQIHPLQTGGQIFNRPEGFTTDDVRRARAAYYGLVEDMDRQIGLVTEAAERKWGTENVLLVYASDHGETLGEHGLFWKENMYDASVRVPLVFRLQGEIAPRRFNAPVSLLDLGPTFISLAGGPELPGAQGENLWPILKGQRPQNDDREVVSIFGRFDPPRAIIRRGKWKLVRFAGSGVDQLFELESDPDELHDLGQSPEHKAVREELSRRLEKWWDPDEIAREYAQQLKHREIMMAYGAKHTRLGDNEQFIAGEEFNRLEVR